MGNKIDESFKQEEGRRLAELIAKSGADSNAAFARAHNIPGGKSMLSQHINGLRPISLECAIAYATGLGVQITEFSPRLEEIISRLLKIERQTPVNHIISEPEQKPYLNISHIRDKKQHSKAIRELITIAETMSEQGQWELLGQARLLAGIHPKAKANRVN